MEKLIYIHYNNFLQFPQHDDYDAAYSELFSFLLLSKFDNMPYLGSVSVRLALYLLCYMLIINEMLGDHANFIAQLVKEQPPPQIKNKIKLKSEEFSKINEQ